MRKKGVKRKKGRPRKVRFSQSMWDTDFVSTRDRWLHWNLPKHLAKLWRQYPPRSRCKDLAEDAGCGLCKKPFAREDMQVDHVVPKGSVPRTIDGWVDYLKKYFCEPANLMSVCIPDHEAKSAREAGERKKA